MSRGFKSRIREELTPEGTDTVYVNGTVKTPEMIRHMLTELETPAKTLTAWESQFIESVGDQFTRRGTLSDKQFQKLEHIYAEKTA